MPTFEVAVFAVDFRGITECPAFSKLFSSKKQDISDSEERVPPRKFLSIGILETTSNKMINRSRMFSHVEELIRIDSESHFEKDIASKVMQELEEMGARVFMDEAARIVQGNSGNVIAYWKGNKPDVPPFLLSAHLDTVKPGKGVKPVRSNGRIKTGGDTILGGDDKSGVSIILEVLRTLKEQNSAHGDLEIVFSVCEEIGLLGAKAVDPKKLRSKDGVVLDSEFASILTTRGPAAVRMEVEIEGLEAHAGVAPERGISALQIASSAVSKMKLGRIDRETTANLGIIEGGLATNIIPKQVRMKGEARSLQVPKLNRQVAHMRRCFEEAARKYFVKPEKKRITGKVNMAVQQDFAKLEVGKNSRVVQLARRAAKQLGYSLREGATGGGSDANVYNRWNIRVANLGTGMREIHTRNEWIDLDDFERSANLVLKMITLHASL